MFQYTPRPTIKLLKRYLKEDAEFAYNPLMRHINGLMSTEEKLIEKNQNAPKLKELENRKKSIQNSLKKQFKLINNNLKDHLNSVLEESDLGNRNPKAFEQLKDIINKFEINESNFNEKYSEISIDANDKIKIDGIKSKMENMSGQLKEKASECHQLTERAFKLINFIKSTVKSAQIEIAEIQTQAINEQINDNNPGSIPFYLQADHLVDGTLWFKDPDTDKVFFILDRSIENGESKYTCPYYEEIKSNENKLFDFKDLPEILQESYKKAEAYIEPNNTSTLQIMDDNPVYNFARFYNSNYKFDAQSNREKLSVVPMYASSKNQNGNLFKTIDWDESIRNSEAKLNYAEQLSDKLSEQSSSWKIAHRVEGSEAPSFSTIESNKNLNKYYDKKSSHTHDEDKDTLRNSGFVFFTLQPQREKRNIPLGIFNSGTLQEFQMQFGDIPLVSCSKDMLGNLKADDPNNLDAFPWFNGTGEEVREQIIKYYVNEKVKNLQENDCNESNISKHINEIIEQIKDDNLEVRIPAKVVADNWESFEYEEK